MTRSDARKLSLWANGQYLKAADHTGFSDGVLTDEQQIKIADEQVLIGQSMIDRSGIPQELDEIGALAFIEEQAAARRRRRSR